MDPSHSFLPNGTFTTSCEFDQFGVTRVQSTASLDRAGLPDYCNRTENRVISAIARQNDLTWVSSLHFGTGGMVESEGMEVTGRRGFYVPGDATEVGLIEDALGWI